jgi:hypothetical protein
VSLIRVSVLKYKIVSVDFMTGEFFWKILRGKYEKNHYDPRNILVRLSSIVLLKRSLSDKYVVTLTKESAEVANLKYISLPFQTDPLKLYLLYPKSKRIDPKNRWIREVLKQLV